MESMSREFALFIDGIRIERGISRLDLIDGIISLSQYKRYLRGVTAIPNDIVLELASRLKYSITDLYSLYNQKHSKEDVLIREVYTEIRKLDYQRAFNLLSKLNPESFISEYYKTSYDFCMILVQHKLGRVSDVHVLQMYSDLIDYPNCLSNETINFVEINALTQIVIVSAKLENYEASKLLYDRISKNPIISSNIQDNSVLSILYLTIARVLYKQGDYEKTSELTKIAYDDIKLNKNVNALPHILLLDALSKKNLGKMEEAYDSVKKCFIQLILFDDSNSIEQFKALYYNDFDLPIEDLLKDIYKMI